MTVCKAKGKVSALQSLALPCDMPGPGIGHTRWATHGEPSDANAHPHVDQSGRIAVVHNGIIENASIIRERLKGQGVVFSSDTDSEVLPHLIAAADTDDLADAVRQALAVIEGTYGIAVLDSRDPGCVVVARNGSPVVIGVGNGENFIASDPAAIVRYTQQAIFLEDGDMAVIRADGFQTYRLDSTETTKRAETFRRSTGASTPTDKGDHSPLHAQGRSSSNPKPCSGRCREGSTCSPPPPTCEASTTSPEKSCASDG